jgi:hypothetical protein
MDNYGKYKLHILRHSLGLQRPPYRLKDSYRNHFATNPQADNYETLLALVSDGLMTPSKKKPDIFGEMEFFFVTEAGKKYVLDHEKTRTSEVREDK